MKKKKIISLLLVLGCVMTACGTNSDTQKTNENAGNGTSEVSKVSKADTKAEESSLLTNTPKPTEILVTEPEISMETLSDSVRGSDGVEAYTYLYTYPNIVIEGNEEAAKMIVYDQDLKRQNFLNVVNNYMTGAKEYYDGVIASDYEYEFYGAGYDKVEYELKFSKAGYISFGITNSSYSIGGAHGNTKIEGVTYDAVTGEVLNLDELFEDGESAVETIENKILDKCLEQGDISSADEEALAAVATIVNGNNWFLAEDGIHFIANEYVLTGFGEYREFTLSYEELPNLKDAKTSEQNSESYNEKDTAEVEENIITGQELDWKDVLENEQEGKKELKEALTKQINMTKLEAESKQELLNDMDKIIESENWYFSKSGIHIVTGRTLTPADIDYEFIVPYDEITQLKEIYRPKVMVGYITNGGSNKVDLDSDGNEDEISYSVNEETYEINLTINGTDFGSKLEELGVYMTEIPQNFCYLADLDEADSYIEIVVSDCGLGETYSTNFLRYDKGNLSYLGRINDDFDSTTCKLLGEGKMLAREVCDIFQSVRLEREYVLEENQIVRKESKWYEMDVSEYRNEEEQICNILKDVTVYTQDSTASATKVLTASDGPVTFPATDGKEWVQLRTTDGTLYYIYVIQSLTIENGMEDEASYEVFDNLLIGG